MTDPTQSKEVQGLVAEIARLDQLTDEFSDPRAGPLTVRRGYVEVTLMRQEIVSAVADELRARGNVLRVKLHHLGVSWPEIAALPRSHGSPSR
jgi:hypothetical protein